MDEEREIIAAKAEEEHLKLISDAVIEYETLLVSQKSVDATDMLDRFVEKYKSRRLEKAKDLLRVMKIPSVLLNHEWIEEENHQPAGEKRDREVSIYEFVKEKLDHWTGVRKDREHGQPACSKTDSAYKLIVWSAELWFFQQLEGIDDSDIRKWISYKGTEELFMKYFSPIHEDVPRFTTVTEEDACTLLQELLKAGKVGNQLEEFLKNWKNIRGLIMGSPMSKEMANIYSKFSRKFYIIPQPEDKWRMYGMHFYLTNFFKDVEGTIVPDNDTKRILKAEAKCMRQAILRCKFKLRGPLLSEFDPEHGTFAQLETWLPEKLFKIKKKCSMLFISFSLHGIQGHLMDTANEFRRIESLLRLINGDPELDELKEIPKVVVIEACQHIPDDERDKEEKFKAISESLKSFVENEAMNLILLMPVEQGERYGLPHKRSYLFRFAEGMNSTLIDPLTPGEVHCRSLKRDAKGTMIQSKSDGREPLLQASAAAGPARERAHGGSDSDDDGYELLSDSGTEVEESEDEDKSVEDNTDY